MGQSESGAVMTATTCTHEWGDRGAAGNYWRECWLCGTVEDALRSVVLMKQGIAEMSARIAEGKPKTMTRKPMTPKAVRVPDELWKAAQTKADERGEYLSEVIRKALERYVSRK